ncbi:MAG TPA: biopolymer transporter ExbD [Gemmatimonadaceae bacterium]|jgi:biopolymer transport protein ExbD/biopolymer transport protein TolR|nr:biopolymer transporter ExbD [Gemmatimonadaceae bacterium]
MPGRRRRHRFDLNADVNVVSLIDVMLLLLVIFMITAPMMQGGLDITLPTAQAKPLESKTGLSISVNRSGEVFVGDATKGMSVGNFRVLFTSMSKNETANGVYLRADKDVPYGVIVQVFQIIQAAGVSDIGLVTETEVIR